MIINITGGPDLTLAEVSEASDIIYSAAHEDANIIFGAVVDPKMEGKVKITVIATGLRSTRAWPLAGGAGARPRRPIDMSQYATLKRARRSAAEERLVANGGRVVVARRPVD